MIVAVIFICSGKIGITGVGRGIYLYRQCYLTFHNIMRIAPRHDSHMKSNNMNSEYKKFIPNTTSRVVTNVEHLYCINKDVRNYSTGPICNKIDERI